MGAESGDGNTKPQNIQMTIQAALELFQHGNLLPAERICRKIISISPNHADALHLLGVIECQNNHLSAGIKLIRQAIQLNPGNAFAVCSLANALESLGRREEALENYNLALKINPEFAQAHYSQANILAELRRFAEALESYSRAIAVAPDFAQAIFNRGNLFAHLNLHSRAMADYDRVLVLIPGFVAALVNRGAMLQKMNRHDDALASYDYALTLAPGDVEALNNRGDVLGQMRRHDEALACFDRALALAPDYHAALYNRGTALRDLKRYEEAAIAYAKLLKLKPDHSFLKGELLHLYMLACDWTHLTSLDNSIEIDLRAGKKSAEPFGYQGISRSARDLKRCAEIYATEKFPKNKPVWSGEKYANDKIRIGYLSGEFRQQATSLLMVELFELHDKDRFELFAFDNGWDDSSEIRSRIKKAFSEIIDITHMSDAVAAAAIKKRQIDILVNLNGYFGLSRQGIFSFRSSPVQVNYLGFPGTIGADYIDYILADQFVIPLEDQDCYTEKVVYLPDSYQVNDSKRRIAKATPSRAACGLPEDGFIFCCFNNNYKITPDIFGVWMRLLLKLDGSILWLLQDNPAASKNLRKAAQVLGVDPDRLIFAPRMPLEEHLARHRLADFFLDTLPYNAHTTASDALWAGLPLLTCLGTTFPGRVAASLLQAVGLPELITLNIEDYEKQATMLALDHQRLSELKNRLTNNLGSCPLFDTDRFRQHIETAYTIMHDKKQRDEPPCSFLV